MRPAGIFGFDAHNLGMATQPGMGGGSSAGGGQASRINTVFNEGSTGATLVGTKPATDLPNSPWAISGTGTRGVFNAGSGATFGPANGFGTGFLSLDCGVADCVITFTGVVFAAGTNFDLGVRSDAAVTHATLIDWNNGTITVTDVGNTNVVVATGSTGATSGTITITLSGQSFTCNFFGTILSGTIPAGSPTLTQTNLLINSTGAVGPTNTTTMVAASLNVR